MGSAARSGWVTWIGAIAAFAAVGCSDDGEGKGFVIGDDLVVNVTPNPVTFGTVISGQHA